MIAVGRSDHSSSLPPVTISTGKYTINYERRLLYIIGSVFLLTGLFGLISMRGSNAGGQLRSSVIVNFLGLLIGGVVILIVALARTLS